MIYAVRQPRIHTNTYTKTRKHARHARTHPQAVALTIIPQATRTHNNTKQNKLGREPNKHEKRPTQHKQTISNHQTKPIKQPDDKG